MTESPSFTPDVEAAAQRLRDVSERLIEASKKNGLSWLEAYEIVLENMLRLEEQAAGGSQVEWVSTLATTHANVVREMSNVFLGTIRQGMGQPPK